MSICLTDSTACSLLVTKVVAGGEVRVRVLMPGESGGPLRLPVLLPLGPGPAVHGDLVDVGVRHRQRLLARAEPVLAAVERPNVMGPVAGF